MYCHVNNSIVKESLLSTHGNEWINLVYNVESISSLPVGPRALAGPFETVQRANLRN